MKAYDSLSSFPDVPPGLSALSSNSSLTAVVFSNGTDSMVSNSVNKSPDLSPHASVFQQLITIEEVKAYKPDPAVYNMLAKKVGKEGKMGEMWLVSGNPFDIVGARAMGMKAAWVDRQGKGWSDHLIQGEVGGPTCICKGLEDVVKKISETEGL